jgi:outer membrane protein assembly factor BamB
MNFRLFIALLLVSAGAWMSAQGSAQTGALDVTQWRGRNRDGGASGFTEPKAWPAQLRQRWAVEVGEGYATPLVVGPRVFTIARRGGNEIMMALDAASGKVVWETSYAAPYKMNPATSGHGQGPKATPLYHDGKLFTLGISGIVSAFDAASGKRLWQTPAPSVDPTFGTSASPLADGNRVVVHTGGHNQGALTAFNKDTGAVVWRWGGDGPAYASPVLATLGGTRQIVTISQQNIVGVAAETGALLWQRPLKTTYDNNSTTPIQFGDTILVSAQEKGVTSLRPVKRADKWEADVVWETREAGLFMSNAVLVDDTLYGLSHLSAGQFFALDAKSGKVLWKTRGREAENTAFVKAANLLFMLNDDAELIVARPNRTAFQAVQRYTVAKTATWAQPAVSGNRIFVKDVSSLALWTVE